MDREKRPGTDWRSAVIAILALVALVQFASSLKLKSQIRPAKGALLHVAQQPLALRAIELYDLPENSPQVAYCIEQVKLKEKP